MHSLQAARTSRHECRPYDPYDVAAVRACPLDDGRPDSRLGPSVAMFAFEISLYFVQYGSKANGRTVEGQSKAAQRALEGSFESALKVARKALEGRPYSALTAAHRTAHRLASMAATARSASYGHSDATD